MNNAGTKFQIGDRVRYARTPGAEVGKVVSITREIETDEVWYGVMFADGEGRSWQAEEVEAAEPKAEGRQ